MARDLISIFLLKMKKLGNKSLSAQLRLAGQWWINKGHFCSPFFENFLKNQSISLPSPRLCQRAAKSPDQLFGNLPIEWYARWHGNGRILTINNWGQFKKKIHSILNSVNKSLIWVIDLRWIPSALTGVSAPSPVGLPHADYCFQSFWHWSHPAK